MHRWILTLLTLVFLAAGVDFSIAQGFSLGWSASYTQSVPTLVAGSFAPASPTAARPSMSTWAPSCLDATWGVGCNVSTQTCIAPSVGTPDEPCQPPDQLVVTGGSGNGTTAEIDYTSQAQYTFPTGTPLNVKGSTDWDTPSAGVVSYAQTTSGNCVTSGHPCVTLGLAPTTGNGPVTAGSVPFIPGAPVYAQAITGKLSGYAGGTNWGFGWGQTIVSGTYDNTITGQLTITLANPYFGASPSGVFNTGNLTFTGGTCTAPCALDGQLTLTSSSGGGTVLVFTPGIGLATANLTATAGNIFNTGQQGPNGKWTPDGTWSGSISSINFDISASFPYGFAGTWGCNAGSAPCTSYSGNTTNAWNYNGFLAQPWPVTASSCTGTSCYVRFAHPTACASACASATTQIVAGQFHGPVMAWMTGPIAPFAMENGTLTKCVSATDISPMRYVDLSLDGGPFVSAAYELDPWGVGAAYNVNDPDKSLVTNNTYVYCAAFPASSVTDGLHEIRAIGCATAGPCSQLTSAITAEATAGSSTLTSNMHYMQDVNRVGITQTQDPAFIQYNNAVNTVNSGQLAISAATYNAGSPPSVTYTYTPTNNILPVPAGFPVNISGVTTTNVCTITGGTTTGNTITYTYTGGCSFPVGTLVNIAGVVSAAQSTSISSASYSSGTGLLTVNLASSPWGATPGYNGITQFTIAGMAFTGTNPNGQRPMITSSGSGLTMTFNLGLGLTTSGLSGGTLSDPYNYTWNGTMVPVTATNGSSTISVTGMALGSYTSGGTITENWNNTCFPTAVTGTTVTCPLPANSASSTATLTTNSRLQANAAVMCVVSGTTDNPAPFNPSFTMGSTMDPNHFQLQYMLNSYANGLGVTNCSEAENNGGCQFTPCGVQATINSTLWLYRKDAGMIENRNNGPVGIPSGVQNDGSLWVETNANSTIMEQAVYVDQWGPSAATTATCIGSPFAAVSYNATRPTYAGTYCANAQIARASFYFNTSIAVSPTVSNSGGCSVFTSATFNSAKLPAGSPMVWLGVDPGAAGDGTNALFSSYGVYWVKANVSGAVTLSATPQGACINETATMSGVKLQQDLGNKDVFFECDQSAGCVPGTTPETVYASGEGITLSALVSQTAESGWVNYSPDTANGTGQHDVDMIWGPNVNVSFSLGSNGRVASNLDRSWKDWTVTPSVSVGPTLSTVTVTGGSWTASAVGSCSSDCETLTFAAGANQFSGATFQAPTASAPGQSIVIAGVTGNGTGSWNCGTAPSPCVATASSTTSVTFQNTALSGASTASAGGTVEPLSLAIEVPQGTFANNGDGTPCTTNLVTACSAQCTNPSTLYQAITPAGGNQACVTTGGATASLGLTGLYAFTLGTTIISNSNCMITPTGGASTAEPIAAEVISGTGSNNDVILMTSGSTANPAYFYNPCPTFQFETTGAFIGTSALDSWDHDDTVTGNWWEGAQTGNSGRLLLTSSGGPSYITNHSAYNAHEGSDSSGYVWGSSFLFNAGTCHNKASTVFHIRCAGGGQVAPTSIGAYNYTIPPSVVNSYSSYANYKAGIPITCSGTPCITTASTVFVLSDNGGGIMPSGAMSLDWNVIITCGFYPAGVVNSASSSSSPSGFITWYDKTNNVIMTANGAAAGCNNLASTGVAFVNGYHTDLNFWTSGPYDVVESGGMGIGVAHEFANRLPWSTMNNIVLDQFDTWLSGDTEQSFTEGGIMFNHAFINSHMISNTNPGVGGGPTIGIDPSTYGCINCLMINDQSNGASIIQIAYNANTNPSDIFRSPMDDLYFINLNVAGSGLPQTMPNYPIGKNFNIWDAAYRELSTTDIWPFYTEIFLGPPFMNAGIWPSMANSVNTSGVPNTGGQPGFNNLLACPWYCTATDPGNGLW